MPPRNYNVCKIFEHYVGYVLMKGYTTILSISGVEIIYASDYFIILIGIIYNFFPYYYYLPIASITLFFFIKWTTFFEVKTNFSVY